ncbi:MAG TPA: pitrilysin family protein [Thermoplasmata archaeon]|nr:pitrilysin family protein [Thermoplasmata archaeon]
MVLRPRFAPEDLERVRRQLFERQLRESTQPGHRADRELLRSVFPVGHPYRRSGLGSHRSLSRLQRADVVRFHRDRTTSAAAFLVVTSSRSLAEVVRLARQTFPEFPSERPDPAAPSARGVGGRATRRNLPMADRSQTEIRVGGSAPPRTDPAYPALALANEVLGGRSLLNRLFQHIRETRGLAYHASSELEAMRWGGYWTAQAGTGPERVERVLELVAKEIRTVAEELIPVSELTRIRESAIGEIPLALETAADAHDLAVDGAYHGLSERHWREWPQVLRSISSREIREATSGVYDPARTVTVVAGSVS